MKKDKNTEAEDMLHDLDRMQGLSGKQWSVDLAKKLGLSADEISIYLAGAKPQIKSK